MPNRYIRASAIESEPVNALTAQAEVFYRRLLNRADDFGRFTANLRLLRSSLFPLQIDRITEKTVAACLAECIAVGLVFTYEADGKPLLVINKWEQGRAKHSDFAAPPADVCESMKTYVYTCKHMFAYAPDSDSDTDSDTDVGQTEAQQGSAAGAAPTSQSDLLPVAVVEQVLPKPKAPTALSDADWLASLSADPAFAGIDVPREHAKAARWCLENRKQLSRRRFVNWLNRAERPMAGAKTAVKAYL